MQSGQERRWSISSNKLVIDDSSWSPRFHTLKKSRRKSRPEETKINCCGTFNYQSSSNLDSSCLESYRYDHSIYFKTIGDIKNGKKETSKGVEEDRVSISSEELVEWDVETVSDFIANQLLEDRYTGNNDENVFDSSESPSQSENVDSVTWYNVDLSKLELNGNEVSNEESNDESLTTCGNVEERNNNYIQSEEPVVDLTNRVVEDENNAEKTEDDEEESEEQGIKRFLECRRTKRAYRTVKQLPIVGENEVLWPSVLLNYTKNIDPSNSPHHYNKLRK